VIRAISRSDQVDEGATMFPGQIIIDGDQFDVTDATAFGTCFNEALNSTIRGYGDQPRHVAVVGYDTLEVNEALNMTDLRQRTVFDFSRARRRATVGSGVTLENLDLSTWDKVRGDDGSLRDRLPDEYPHVGILVSRAARDHGTTGQAWPSAGEHRFMNVAIQGHYRIATAYVLSSENNSWFAPKLVNNHPAGEATLALAH
jgi:hypothetical protein